MVFTVRILEEPFSGPYLCYIEQKQFKQQMPTSSESELESEFSMDFGSEVSFAVAEFEFQNLLEWNQELNGEDQNLN